MAGKTKKEKQQEIEEKAKAALALQTPTDPPTDGEAQQTAEPPAGSEATQENTQPPTDGGAQEATTQPPTDGNTQQLAEIKEKSLEGKALVVYNGYINIRRAPLMTDDAICGQVRRGQVLNVVAAVTIKDVEFYRLAGGEYIKADKKLVEFTKA